MKPFWGCVMRIKRPRVRFDDWPQSDQVAWNHAISTGISLLDEQGSAAHWADKSKQEAMTVYSYWLGFVKEVERQDPARVPITRQGINRYIDYLSDSIAATSIAIQLQHLYHAIRVMYPAEDWKWLRALITHLQKKAQKGKCKYPSPVDSKTLFELGIQMMQEANNQPVWNKKQFRLYRDGLMIAVLAARPIRRRTMALIEVGKQLRLINGRWHLIFAPDEVKNRRPLEFELPEKLTAFINRYLDHYRPNACADPDIQAFWISHKTGRALTDDGIYNCIKKRTQEYLGEPINMHQFRHCAATTIARRNPDQVLTIAPLLGHATPDAAFKHYVVSQGSEASATHQSLITSLRHNKISLRSE